MDKFVDILKNIGQWFITEGVKAIIGLICFWLFCKLINFIFKRIQKSLNKKQKFNHTVTNVVIVWSRRIIKIITFIILLGIIGIQTSGITAAIASLGLAIGLALQGSLSNFAGGILILALHPYKVGDFIEFNSFSGTVQEIQLFYTYLNTVDNKRIVIPNSAMSNSNIVNYSANKTRRDDIKISINYSSNFESVKTTILQLLSSQSKILTDPSPTVSVYDYLDSGIQLTIRFWSDIDDFWNIHFNVLNLIKQAIDDNTIQIPYPQLDVHIADSNTIKKTQS